MKYFIIVLVFLTLFLVQGVAYALPPISFTRVYVQYVNNAVSIVGQQIKDCDGRMVHGGDISSPYFIEIRNPCSGYDKSVTFCELVTWTKDQYGNDIWSCMATETVPALQTDIAYVVLPAAVTQQDVCSAITNTAPWLDVENCVFTPFNNASYAGMQLFQINYLPGWIGQI
jgi:hypothetical protein